MVKQAKAGQGLQTLGLSAIRGCSWSCGCPQMWEEYLDVVSTLHDGHSNTAIKPSLPSNLAPNSPWHHVSWNNKIQSVDIHLSFNMWKAKYKGMCCKYQSGKTRTNSLSFFFNFLSDCLPFFTGLETFSMPLWLESCSYYISNT